MPTPMRTIVTNSSRPIRSGRDGIGPRLGRFLLVSVVLLVAVAACGRVYEFNGTLYNEPMPAPALEGTNWDGSEFDLRELEGNVVMLFFGYTFCPDICPITLAEVTRLVGLLEEDAGSVDVVFVSVDPDRDTPERLAAYVPAFNPDFYGVFIPSGQLEAVKRGYGVYAEKRNVEGESAAGYLVDHTGGVYVVDKDGKLRVVFGHDTPAETMEPDIRYLMSE